MSEANTPESRRTEAEEARHRELLKHKALEQSEVKEVLNFFRTYAKPAAIVILTVCGLILVNNFFKNNRINKERKADAVLMQARSAADYEAILDQYGSTPSAPLALMALAQIRFNDGAIDAADELYGDFLRKYSRHEMAEQAQFNRITCTEARGDNNKAVALYDVFLNDNPESYLAPAALLGKGRSLEDLGQYAEAKQSYEDVIVNYPGGNWALMAERSLNTVESKIK